jgi:hypothetical protein
MKSERLLDLIGEISSEKVATITGNDSIARTRRQHWHRWAAVAASLFLVVSVGGYGMLNGWFSGARSGQGGPASANADGSSIFMSYAGPLFPLTLKKQTDNITAQRQITWNFSPFTGKIQTYQINGDTKSYESWQSESLVRDSYVLSNSGDQDITVKAIYPYSGSIKTGQPDVTVDGVLTATTLHPGLYTGTFSPAVGSSRPGETLNLAQIDSWEAYLTLLKSGDYLQSAFQGASLPLDQPVVVYAFTDPVKPVIDDANPILAISFSLDRNTIALSFGMNGSSIDTDKQWRRFSFSVPGKEDSWYDQTVAIILIGGDIDSYTLQGYSDGSCDDGKELDGVSAAVTRYETTLGAMLEQIVAETINRFPDMYGDGNDTDVRDVSLYTSLVAETLYNDGPLSDDMKMRYDDGMLESVISDTLSYGRVLYLSFEVVIPAGGGIVIDISMKKDASVNYTGSGRNNRYGFDLVTKLGTNLTFSELTASLVNCDAVEIINQNMGFDLESGINTVSLDLETAHYYLEVARKNQ